MYLNPDRSAALLALKIIYIGGCFQPWRITMCEASLCHIRVSRLIRMLTFSLSSVMYGFVLTIGHSPIFYKSFSVEALGSAVVMGKEYGPMHTVHYIVHEILRDTDDEEFRRIAENVAHYHHEKADGSGYPDGLKGEAIPLEARIMAVADVYDALVSKRVYKEKFSFEKADAIICDGMGTQFDARLRPYYEKARPRLEAFYSAEP